ncbi:MAG: hypothetical protein K2W95_26135 [Candidatus Obscuribacterales bacterium]|nr:hypothetical protein [Candidatus Obscuribacterales bacterium]
MQMNRLPGIAAIAASLSLVVSSAPGDALAAPPAAFLRSVEATYELDAKTKDIVINNNSEIAELRKRGAINLPGLGPGSKIWLKKGSKLEFRGNAAFRIASGAHLVLEPNARVILKAGAAGVELVNTCVVAANQIVIVDAGKVLGSEGGVPAIFSK